MTTPPVDYSSLLRDLQQRAALTRQPVSGVFELTERCNLSCRMCYVRHCPGDPAQRARELKPAQWHQLARDAVDHGLVFLLLTGGEVFLRPDFFEIYAPLTRLGLIVTVFTNGTLITDAIARRLAEAAPSLTEITLYGATAATYEAVTGAPGSYARVRAGIEALARHGVPFGLKATLVRQNIGELAAMRQMARDFGVSFSGAWLLSQRRDQHPSDVEGCRLSAQACVDLEATDPIAADQWLETAFRESSANSAANFNCQAGKTAFVIDAAGEMNACISLSEPRARPLETGFRAAWERVQRFTDHTPPPDPACRACDARSFCPRCPAWSSTETGTLTAPIPYLCEIARIRKARYEAERIAGS